jgi:ComF family protein
MLRAMQRLLDMLMPPVCPACALEGEAPCRRCLELMGRQLEEPVGVPLGLAHSQPAGLVQLEWCGPYSGAARDCLRALKYDGEQRLAIPLGRLMARRWRQAGIGGDIVTAVPVHAGRRRDRGFDQAELLAAVVARELGLPALPALERSARTVAQHALSRGARQQNVGRVFAVPERQQAALRGRWVIVIDDVSTTGATLAACAQALYTAGARAVSALTLARER